MLFGVLLAQAAAAAVSEPPQPQGVISYPASYFAAQQPANASDMVGRLPGFILDDGDSVRGFEGAAGNVLIDGQRPASKTDTLDEILRRIPASEVERIDLIRGGAPGVDMQGKTVIANVVRKTGSRVRGLVAGSQTHTWDGRTAGAARLEASGSLGERKWEVGSFFGKGVDDGSGIGPGVRLAPGEPPVAMVINPEGDVLNGFVTGSFETPLAGGKARVNGRVARDKYKFEEEVRILGSSPGVETTYDVNSNEHTELGGNYTRALGSRTTLEAVALRQGLDRRVDTIFVDDGEESDFELDRESSETIGRIVLKHRFDDRLSVEGGGEFALNKLESRTRFSVAGGDVDLPASDVRVEERRSELILKSAWRPAPAWSLDAGLRYESSKITSNGDVGLSKNLHFLKPRLAATWAPASATQVRARLERVVGQLDFDDFVASASLNTGAGVTAGNPDLDPEQAWVAEAAVEQRFWGSGVVVLTYRRFQLKDVVDRGPVFTGTTVFDTPTNIGDGTKDELALEISIPLGRIGLKGAEIRGEVTRRWSEVTDPTTHRKREISGLNPVNFNATLTQDVPQWRLNWGVDVFGGARETYYRFDLIETTKSGTYLRPFAEWRPVPDINLRVELPNITSRGVRRTLHFYPGARSAGGAPSIEDREYRPGQMIYVRVRKMIG